MTYFVPPEWSPQRAMWTAWPAHPDLWCEDLDPARDEIEAMVVALAKDQVVKVLVMGDDAMRCARATFAGHANVQLVPARYGDIWVRDTGCVFGRDREGGRVGHNFAFNYWGNKFDLPFDTEVGQEMADAAAVHRIDWDFVLEGGSIDVDGTGRLLTTKQCLLNANRNPSFSQAQIEARLKDAFGAAQVLWLDEGLLNDHTDGHIDNIARFVAPGRVVCQAPSGNNDPNAATLDRIARALSGFGLDVVRIPSPGLIADDEGQAVPASHMNFIIGNKTVVVPTYEKVYAQEALATLAALFPGRNVIGCSATAILTGGGSFHCITQQEPL